MEKKRYVVKLGDLEIGLKSHDTKEYIDEIAAYVNKLHGSFKSASANISNLESFALSALSAADELFKQGQRIDGLKAELNQAKSELSESLGRVMMLEAELHVLRTQQEGLREDCAKLERTLKDGSQREERFKEKLNVLSYELKKPIGDRVYKKELNEAARLLEEMLRQKQEEAEAGEARAEDERQLSVYDVID